MPPSSTHKGLDYGVHRTLEALQSRTALPVRSQAVAGHHKHSKVAGKPLMCRQEDRQAEAECEAKCWKAFYAGAKRVKFKGTLSQHS